MKSDKATTVAYYTTTDYTPRPVGLQFAANALFSVYVHDFFFVFLFVCLFVFSLFLFVCFFLRDVMYKESRQATKTLRHF